MHMTLPVPEHEPHLSPPTLNGPVPPWLINPWLFPSTPARNPESAYKTCLAQCSSQHHWESED